MVGAPSGLFMQPGECPPCLPDLSCSLLVCLCHFGPLLFRSAFLGLCPCVSQSGGVGLAGRVAPLPCSP